jgi:molecular chaperone DnaJ
MTQNYYTLLGVDKGASQDEIKKSYRKLAVKHHPDKNPGDEKSEVKFKEINAAYDILKNEQKRAAYDRYGEDAFNGTGGRQSANAGGFDFNGGAGGGFSDIFEDLFGGARGRGQGQGQAAQNRGSDMRYNLEIDLEDAFVGSKKEISIPGYVVCDSCVGSGSADKGAVRQCDVCHGTGKVRIQQGFFMIERACANCNGQGTIIKNPCKKCYGQGRVKKTRKLSVKIPVGVEEGTRIRLTGEGEAGVRGGSAGDLYIFVSIKEHELFEREGPDLHCFVPISFAKAALGGSVDVPTIERTKARISIPEGTQTGGKFRLKAKGMPMMRRTTTVGDMYVHTIVETPVKMTKKQIELLEAFKEIDEKKSTPIVDRFYKQVSKYLK